MKTTKTVKGFKKVVPYVNWVTRKFFLGEYRWENGNLVGLELTPETTKRLDIKWSDGHIDENVRIYWTPCNGNDVDWERDNPFTYYVPEFNAKIEGRKTKVRMSLTKVKARIHNS